MSKTPKSEERTVKTTVVLSETLWKAAKHRALDEGGDLRTIIIAALKEYLSRPARKGETR